MAAYNLFDLLGQIVEMLDDGYSYAEISEIPNDDECPTSLYFASLQDEDFSVEYDGVDSLPNDYDYSRGSAIRSDTPCYALTLQETETALHALNNALEYFKECTANKDGMYNSKVLDDIKSSSISCRNLQDKIRKFLNHFE